MAYSGSKKFKCEHCEKQFRTKFRVKRHHLVHTGERPHTCLQCYKTFSRSDHLRRHEKTHLDQNSLEKDNEKIHSSLKKFECDDCKKIFKERKYLISHIRLHTGEKPYECEFCQEKFTYSRARWLHERDHHDLKKYKCEECSRIFIKELEFIHHIRLHAKKRPYKCKPCVETFNKLLSRKGKTLNSSKKDQMSKLKLQRKCANPCLTDKTKKPLESKSNNSKDQQDKEIHAQKNTSAVENLDLSKKNQLNETEPQKRFLRTLLVTGDKITSSHSQVFNKSLQIRIERIRIEDYFSSNSSKNQQCKEISTQKNSSMVNNLNSNRKNPLDETEPRKIILNPFFSGNKRISSNSKALNQSSEIKTENNLLLNNNFKNQLESQRTGRNNQMENISPERKILNPFFILAQHEKLLASSQEKTLKIKTDEKENMENFLSSNNNARKPEKAVNMEKEKYFPDNLENAKRRKLKIKNKLNITKYFD